MAENAFKADWPSFALGFNTGKSKGGGGAELNIHYSLDTPPEDTSMLWVKTSKPNGVRLTAKVPTQIKGIGNEYAASSYYNKLGYQPEAPACGVIGNRIYVLGGYTDIRYMDIETLAVTGLSEKLPQSTHHMAYATVGNKIYMFGGRSNTGDVYNTVMVFDADTGKAEILDDVVVPVHHYGMTAQAIGTKIYIFGGRESASSSSVFSYFIFRFDTETNEFYGDNYETTLPVFIADMASAVVGNKIYLFGGYEKGVGASNIIMEYDPETHKVRTLSSTLPERLYGSACAVYGNEVFLFGGITSNNQGYSTYIIRFDPNTEQAEKVSTPTLNVAIGYAVAAEAGNCIYIFGGKRNSSNSHVLYYYKYGYEVPSGSLCMLIGNGRGFEVFKNDGNITMYLNTYKCYKGNQDNVGEKIPFATYQSGAWSEYK